MLTDCVIDINNLSKSYKIFNKPTDRVKEALNPFGHRYSKDFYALKNVSFEISRGETVGIIGKNGAGKSTLLKIITGVLTPTSGEVHINGSIASLLELGAGFNPELSGIENIFLNGMLMGRTKREMSNLLPNIKKFANIGEFIYQPVKTYSSGMFSRLAFATNVFVEPDILIVDEALSVGDTRFQIKCMKKIKELMERGTAILFVSHYMNIIRRFCTRAIWLNSGCIQCDGDANWVVDRYTDDLKIKEAEQSLADKKINKKVVVQSDIAEILSFDILDVNNHIVNEVSFNQPLKIRISYQVYQENVQKPVVGISIRTLNNEYICGLNTLLDKISIPWKKGINSIELSYSEGLRVLGGKYYFDTALFEETATIPFQFITYIKDIVVTADYVGEGTFIIPHCWNINL